MFRQIGQLLQQAKAIRARLAHADDAAGADIDAGVADKLERVQPIFVGARGDDLAVILRRGIEIVVVVIEAGVFQLFSLMRGEHAQRHAGFQPQSFYCFDHFQHHAQIFFARTAPGGAHAETRRAAGFCRLGIPDHFFQRQQLFFRQAGVVMTALRAIGAVFRAGAGLDRQQRRGLHGVGVEVPAMNALCDKEQIVERQGEQLFDFG